MLDKTRYFFSDVQNVTGGNMPQLFQWDSTRLPGIFAKVIKKCSLQATSSSLDRFSDCFLQDDGKSMYFCGSDSDWLFGKVRPQAYTELPCNLGDYDLLKNVTECLKDVIEPECKTRFFTDWGYGYQGLFVLGVVFAALFLCVCCYAALATRAENNPSLTEGHGNSSENNDDQGDVEVASESSYQTSFN